MAIAVLLDISLNANSEAIGIYSAICGTDLAGVEIRKEIDIRDLEGWRQIFFSDKTFSKVATCDCLLRL